MLPATRFDPARRLYLIGAEPSDVVKRTRGLVLVNMQGSRKEPAQAKSARRTAGEAVLHFSTLP